MRTNLTAPNLARTVKQFVLLASAAIIVFGLMPAQTVLATTKQIEDDTITIEEYYRENDITFYGRDMAACDAAGAGGAANINVDKNFSLGKGAKERRVNLAKALMRDYGLTAAQAAGIVGNFMQESGGAHLPPDVNQGGRAGPPSFSGGYGWAQWTGPRQTTFINFAVKHGYMKNRNVRATDAANYAYLKHELNTAYKSTVTQLKKQKTAVDAAFSFHKTFEKSADNRSQIGERGTSAKKVLNELKGGGGGGGATAAGGECAGGGGIVGDNAFPLKTTQSAIKNRNMFKGGTSSKGGHPYTAYDILVKPGTPVVAFLSGKVTHIGEDRCPGRLVSVYNKESNLTVSYLHMNMSASTHAKKGDVLRVGQRVGQVGPPSAGCGIAHLHIDVAKGKTRPGCSRLNCPRSNASKFVNIGPELFKTYQALPK